MTRAQKAALKEDRTIALEDRLFHVAFHAEHEETQLRAAALLHALYSGSPVSRSLVATNASDKIGAALRDALAVARDAAAAAAIHGHIGGDRYTLRPLSAEDGGGFLIEFPDLPGCMSDGETAADAIANGAEAHAAWLAAMREAGRR